VFALAFYDETDDGSTALSFEFGTVDFDEVIESLWDARNESAAGNHNWDNSQLAIWVLRDGVSGFEVLNDGSRVE
jgi:hypothetical protein